MKYMADISNKTMYDVGQLCVVGFPFCNNGQPRIKVEVPVIEVFVKFG